MRDTEPLIESIRRDGYAIAHDLIAPSEVREIKDSLAPWLRGELRGRNDFEGFCSERVYALLAKAPPIARLVEHPALLAVIDGLLRPHYRLSACLAINVHPGETAQAWHADDGYVPIPRPREMVGVSAIWALDDFTETNGATEVIPGSHRWGHAECAAASERDAVKVIMPAGSALLFAGTLLHRGGAHRGSGTRLAITPQYCEGWLRQIENLPLAVPPELARNYSERVQALLGYDIFEPTFIGYVDGMHPKRLLGPEYAARKQERTKVVLPH